MGTWCSVCCHISFGTKLWYKSIHKHSIMYVCVYNNILLGVIIFCKTTNKNSFQSFVKVGDMMDVTQNIKVHSLE